MVRTSWRLLASMVGVSVLAFAASAADSGGAQPPETPKSAVTDMYHGTSISEDFRWLENWDDAKVKAWSEAQSTYTRGVLDALPGVADIRARLTELESGQSADYRALKWQAGKLFSLKYQPPKQQPLLVWLASPEDPKSEKVIIDPNEMDSGGGTSIDWFFPSLDGKLVAVSISQGGSESGDVHVFETETGKKLGDVVPRVNGGTAGGGLAWNSDGTGFLYTRYPREGERAGDDMHFYQQVYFHKLGDDTSKDTYEVGKEFPRIAEIELQSSPDGKWHLATIANGDGGEHMHWLRNPSAGWRQITKYEDKVVDAKFGWGDLLFVLTRKEAPKGEIYRMNLSRPDWDRTGLILARGLEVYDSIHLTPTNLIAVMQEGGPNGLRIVDYTGSNIRDFKLPRLSTVGGVVPMDAGRLLVRTTSLTEAPAWYTCTEENLGLIRTALHTTSPAVFFDCETVRLTATSTDGTKVPMTLLRKRGTKLDGTNPTILYGYGGYGVNTTPNFQARHRLWVEQGGVYVMAHIRGGGEGGEEWHLNGNLTKKQNVFDDFLACAQTLIDMKYTNPKRLAIWGGSNGGLLMGAAFTQRPDLFGAVISSVGIYDMLRVELHPNGAFNVTEFGTVTNPEQFKALAAYSPYHHVKDGTPYPPTLMITGANDPRVDPMHSRKMTARLQAANPGGCHLLRTSANTGHGGNSSLSQRIEQNVDAYAFLFNHLGVEYKPMKSTAGGSSK